MLIIATLEKVQLDIKQILNTIQDGQLANVSHQKKQNNIAVHSYPPDPRELKLSFFSKIHY